MQRKLVAAAVSSALAVPMAAQAVEFEVSGQINRAIISVDNAKNADGTEVDDGLQHVDNNGSESRFRFKGSGDLDNGMTAGVHLEYGLGKEVEGNRHPNVRQANLSLNTAGGKLTLGHASSAADGMAHADNAFNGGSWLAGVTNWCSFYAKNADGAGAVACPSNDGGRRDVLRYDTPTFGPATISISTGDDDYWDAKLSIAGSFGDAGYDIRVGHIGEYETVKAATKQTSERVTGAQIAEFATENDLNSASGGDDISALAVGKYKTSTIYLPTGVAATGTEDINTLTTNAGTLYTVVTPATPASKEKQGDITTASAAVSFGQGTSVGVAWSKDEDAKPSMDHEYTYMAVDHSYGDGSVGVYWKQGEKGTGPGKPKKKGSLWGVGIGHAVGNGASVYAGYRQIKEDGVKDNVGLVVAGMRVTFN